MIFLFFNGRFQAGMSHILFTALHAIDVARPDTPHAAIWLTIIGWAFSSANSLLILVIVHLRNILRSI